jgi:hypothetical protein
MSNPIFEGPEPIRIIQEQAQAEAEAQAQAGRAPSYVRHAPLYECPQRLERTTECVWPEDEQREAAELARRHRRPVPLLGDEEADALLASVTVALPEKLPVCSSSSPAGRKSLQSILFDPPTLQDTDVSGQHGDVRAGQVGAFDAMRDTVPGDVAPSEEMVGFRIKTTFDPSSREDVILRRLRLRLVLTSPEDDRPVAVCMVPTSDVNVKRVAEFEVNLGKILGILAPNMSDVFVARTGFTIDVTKVHPRIQASGLWRHECLWRLSDSEIEYNFYPALVAQHRSSAEFKVLAELHVEVRKRVFGVWHRTYGKSADSMWYQYHPGQSVMPAFNFLEAEEPHMSGTYTSRLRQLMYAGSYWLRRAANAGIPDAMCIIARDYEDQDRFNEAKPLYERAAVLGHYSAPWLPRNIKINKESWERQYRLRMAAESGSTDAMIHLANTLQDASWPGPNEAERWLRKAAKADNDDAMVLLGTLIEQRSPREAEAWYKQAAKVGNTSAKRNLIRLHPRRVWYRLR